MRFLNKVIFLSFILVVFFAGCSKENDLVYCTAEWKPAFAEFNVVDKQTGEDLFFVDTPRYNTSQIVFFKTSDKLQKDTIRPAIEGSGKTGFFKLALINTVERDTLIMKLPAKGPAQSTDLYIYTIKKTGGDCPQSLLDRSFINGIEITPENGRLIFKK
ncbi:hypothetical protein [Pedobacter antarcticus]|uniref:hypothetical protein n=1 Tax=Pedobacter antarcticus TaxID=34086 RepID=UPI00292D049D|nr:hypothetical protein [Pedobacter antarcticus]